MVRTKLLATVSALAILGGGSLAPIAAQAGTVCNNGQQLQSQRNDWRNAEIGSAIVGVYGLISHRGGIAAAGALGTIISANQFDRDSRLQNDRDNRDNRGSDYRNQNNDGRGFNQRFNTGHDNDRR
jgi:hypothetical protein